MLYSAQGGDVRLGIGPYTGGDHKAVINYLKVPLLLSYKVGNSLFFELGPQISFLVSQQIKSNAGGIRLGAQENKRSFKKDDLSVAAE